MMVSVGIGDTLSQMGNFNYSCSVVLNSRLPIGARFNAFVRCCSAVARLGAAQNGGLRMQAVYDRLGTELGFSRHEKPSSEQMITAVSRLITARFRLLHERTAYAQRRKKAKQLGNPRNTTALYESLIPLDLLNSHVPKDSGAI